MKSLLITIKLAFQGILSNKVRAFLTMLGIIIGVGSVISIMSIGAGAQSLITGSLQKMGTNLIGVLPGAADEKGPPASAYGIVIKTLTYEDAKAVESLQNIDGISAYANGNGEISYQNRSMDTNFSGITSAYPQVEKHEVARGRFFTEQEERSGAKLAVLGAEIKEELFPFTDPIGKKIKIKNKSFTVIGVMEKKGGGLMSSGDDRVFLPLSVAQKLLLGTRHLSLIRVKVDSEENVNLAMEQIRRVIRHRHRIKDPANDDFNVRSIAQALEVFEAVTGGLKFFLACIAAVSLIVGGIGITNVMLMTVKERTKEIGLKKAIGAKPSQIENQFIIEALVLTGFGGILGILGGTTLSYLVAFIANYLDYDWAFEVTLSSILISFSVSLVIGLIFGFYPARRAARLNPIDALRYE